MANIDDDVPRFKASIQEFTPQVYNQKGYDVSMAIVMADMVSTIYRMNGINVTLSPQIVVDAGIKPLSAAMAMLKDPRAGLQAVEDYPFIWVAREHLEYQPGKHYSVDDMVVIPQHKLKQEILSNFLEGDGYPMIGILYKHDLDKPGVAKEAYYGVPYRHYTSMDEKTFQQLIDKKASPLVLIVGVDTTSDDPIQHHCLVKNCRGRKWGVEGYTNIAFETFVGGVKATYNRCKISRKELSTPKYCRQIFLLRTMELEVSRVEVSDVIRVKNVQ